MNFVTILIWVTIVIIGAIAIIGVKLHYRGNELETEEGSILPSTEGINEALNKGKDLINTRSENKSSTNAPRSLSPNVPKQESSNNLFRKHLGSESRNDDYISPEVEDNNSKNYEYQSQNQVLINYENNVKKFQEPIKQSQMDIMSQNNKDTSELKDLFTIDELIKESKRKDTEREKESQKISKPEDDEELNELKESIKNKTPEPLIEEVIAEDSEEKISDVIKSDDDSPKSETDSVASQKDIDEAISSASKESEDEVESISEESNITDTLLSQEKTEEISEPALKTPSKVGENKDYKMGASIDDADLFNNDKEEDTMDLDYRKDLDKVKNKITGSKIFQDVKEKLVPEEVPPAEDVQNEFIRNVNEYDEYEPIINETHIDIDDGSYEDYHNQKLRQENTRRVFRQAKVSPEPAKPNVGEIKEKPSRANIKINLNNNEVVLKKGDEIIYTHDGETYSSQVYAIKGDDIAVRYRGKNIKIKASDVKKIY